MCGSQGTAGVRKWAFRSLAVKAEQKCGSGTLHLWKSGSAAAYLHVFDSQGRAEVRTETSNIWKSRESGSAEVVSFTQSSRGTSNENRLRKRGSGENVSFLVMFLIGDTNV